MGYSDVNSPKLLLLPHKRYTVNSQIGVADSKYVVLDDPLPPGNVTRHMRIANFAIKMAHSHSFQPLLSNGSR